MDCAPTTGGDLIVIMRLAAPRTSACSGVSEAAVKVTVGEVGGMNDILALLAGANSVVTV